MKRKLNLICAVLTLLAAIWAFSTRNTRSSVHHSVNNPGLAPEAKLIKPLKGGPDWPVCPTPVPDDWYCQ